jgi:cytochrome c biogenesis protein CcdA
VGAGVTVVGVAVMAVATFQTGRDSALVAVGMALIWLGVLLLGRGPSTGLSTGSSTGSSTGPSTGLGAPPAAGPDLGAGSARIAGPRAS